MSLELLEKRFTDLQDRLNLLQDATSQLEELIQRLANFDFQPGSVPLGAAEDDNVGTELSSEINQVLREQEEDLELLKEEIIDIRPGRSGSTLQHDKDRLQDGAERLERKLQLCRKSFRKAQITAKRNLQLAQQHERELLYASFSSPRSGASTPASATATTTAQFPRRSRKLASEMTKEEQMISASHDVTESMRRTHDMMSAELVKSDFAHNTLQESTQALAQLSENYSSLDTMLSSSRALLGTLLKSQKTDTWYLQSAFYLLTITIGWLIFRRLLWGPTWWLVWLPLKLLFKTAVGISNTVGLRGSQIQSDSESASVGVSPQQPYMNNRDVPTIEVGGPLESQAVELDGSMIEEVGKIIDKSQVGAQGPDEVSTDETELRERTAEEQPNPKKRMMEEEEEHADIPTTGDQRVKDEL
ncbi:Sec20-domain-containing protein [Xylaria bambusicola]|uniref:Sec20-domain-containing protein n=1 Tax=Xylaria bambusicola TaxID=326684 RepID=UPI00200836AE|nr:Sec20-domain-containing protein [Xylaria bambusicola]KAI0526054.1 Sec20-domain-containing protein [Xylaria bambusicola]